MAGKRTCSTVHFQSLSEPKFKIFKRANTVNVISLLDKLEGIELHLVIVGSFVKVASHTTEGVKACLFRIPISFSCQTQNPSG